MASQEGKIQKPLQALIDINKMGIIRSVLIYEEPQECGRGPIYIDFETKNDSLKRFRFDSVISHLVFNSTIFNDGVVSLNNHTKERISSWNSQEWRERSLYESLKKKWEPILNAEAESDK